VSKIAFSLCKVLLAAVATATFAQAPVKTVKVPVAPASAAEPLPRVSGNSLVEFQTYSEVQGASKIRLLDLGTRTWRELDPWPPEPAIGLTVKKVLPRADGRVFVGLRVTSPLNQRAEVFAVYDKSGKRTSWFRTNPFAWDDFAVDEKETLWMFGHCPDYLAATCGSEFQSVRRYTLEGHETGAFLPLSSFSQDPFAPPRIAGQSQIFATRGRIGVYAPATEEFVQMDLGGQLLSREKLSLPAEVYFTRFAMSGGGGLYLRGATGGVLRWESSRRQFLALPSIQGGSFCGIEDGYAVLMSTRIGENTTISYHRLAD